MTEQDAVASWDFDSDEIASIDSADLHQSRPNRWTGERSTWRHYTREERMLWRSLKQLGNEDLAKHLYNAVELAKRQPDPEQAQDDPNAPSNNKEEAWKMPRAWAAWPVAPKHLPPHGLFNQTEQEDDDETYRRTTNNMPSTDLEEEITALILRFSKQRFDKAKSKENKDADDDVVIESIETEVANAFAGKASDFSRSRQSSIGSSPPVTPSNMHVDELQSDPELEMMSDDEQTTIKHDSSSGWETEEADALQAEFLADDDQARELLRPSARHIISKLEELLLVLQAARLACLPRNAFAPNIDDGDADDEGDYKPRRRKAKDKTQAATHSNEYEIEDVEMDDVVESSQRDKATNDAGFDRWMRGQESTSPETPDEELKTTDETTEDPVFEAWFSGKPVDAAPEVESDSESDDIDGTANFDEQQRKWRLRDWSDVIGAAALADLPPTVVHRTAQRCANLFEQSMILNRMPETTASKGTLVDGMLISPQSPRPESMKSSDSDSDHLEPSMLQRRIRSSQASRQTSRQTSLARDISEERGRGRNADPTLPESHTRTRSNSEHSAGIFLCPVPSCPRAARRFDRKRNLKRHMKLVHPDVDDSAEEVDSGDEMQGAVHVDGFLRPINAQRGWRGRGANPRKRARSSSSTPATPARADQFSSANSSSDDSMSDSEDNMYE